MHWVRLCISLHVKFLRSVWKLSTRTMLTATPLQERKNQYCTMALIAVRKGTPREVYSKPIKKTPQTATLYFRGISRLQTMPIGSNRIDKSTAALKDPRISSDRRDGWHRSFEFHSLLNGIHCVVLPM